MSVALSNLQDTVVDADGTPASGHVSIYWPQFMVNSAPVTQGQRTYDIIDGQINLNLYPTVNAQPAGAYYTATFELDNGSVYDEYWVVPNLPTVKLNQIRAMFPPQPGLFINALQITGGGAQNGQFLGWNGTQWVPTFVTTLNVTPNWINLSVTSTPGADLSVVGSPVILGNMISLNVPDAGATSRGVMTTGPQTFAGAKTFNDPAVFNSALTLGSFIPPHPQWGQIWFDSSNNTFNFQGSLAVIGSFQASAMALNHLDLSQAGLSNTVATPQSVVFPGQEAILLPRGAVAHGIGVDVKDWLWLGSGSAYASLRPDAAWVASWLDLSVYQHPIAPNVEALPSQASILLYQDAGQWIGMGVDTLMRIWFRIGPNNGGTYYYLHQDGGSLGVATWVNSTQVATRAGINLIAGQYVTMMATDNPGRNTVDVTISAAGNLVDPLTTRGDLIARGHVLPERLPAIYDGQYRVLTCDASRPQGLAWTVGVPTTRRIIAGAGLWGGGDLSGDVDIWANVLSVFGRTGNVILTGADIINAGGVMDPTLIKGDLIVRSPWLTVNRGLTRLGAGPDGSVLVTDSTLDLGMKWVPGGDFGAQTPWIQNIDGANYTLTNVGALQVNGATQLDSTLSVAANTSLSANLSVGGDSTLTGDLSVGGNGAIALNLSVGGDLTVDGATQLTGDLNVDGDFGVTGQSTLVGNVNLGADLDVVGDASLGGTLTVAGDAAVAGMLAVTDDAALGGILAVAGDTALGGILTVVGDAALGGDLDVVGDALIGGTLGVAGDTTLAGALDVTGATSIIGDVTVTGDTVLAGALDVTGDTALTGDFAVTGDSAFTGDLSVTGQIEVPAIYSGSTTPVVFTPPLEAGSIDLNPDIQTWGNVQAALEAIDASITTLSRGMSYVGSYDAANDVATFVPSLSSLDGPLPAADATGLEQGDFLIATSDSAGPPLIQMGDQLISGGSTGGANWDILSVGHVAITASMVAVSPQVGPWTDVQTAIADIASGAAQTPWLSNINAAGYTLFSGTTTNALIFGTGSPASITERMRIASNGNVGIGLTAPAALLSVNGNAQISNVLYTPAATNLIFGAGSATERMRISVAGNVGINSTLDTYRLTVGGNLNVTGDYYLNGVLLRADNIQLNPSINGFTTVQAALAAAQQSPWQLNINANNYILCSGSTTNNLRFATGTNTSPTVRMQISPANHVAIGNWDMTTMPDADQAGYRLVIGTTNSTTTGILTLGFSGSTGGVPIGRIDFVNWQNSTQTDRRVGSIRFMLGASTNQGRFAVNVYASGGVAMERLHIHENGHVGMSNRVGTTAVPFSSTTSNLFLMVGPTDSTVSSAVGAVVVCSQITADNTLIGTFSFANYALTTTEKRLAYLACFRETADNMGNLRFYTANSGSPAERMRITAAGFLGVGTTAPGYRLHVVGDAYVTGSFGLGTTDLSRKLNIAGDVRMTGTIMEVPNNFRMGFPNSFTDGAARTCLMLKSAFGTSGGTSANLLQFAADNVNFPYTNQNAAGFLLGPGEYNRAYVQMCGNSATANAELAQISLCNMANTSPNDKRMVNLTAFNLNTAADSSYLVIQTKNAGNLVNAMRIAANGYVYIGNSVNASYWLHLAIDSAGKPSTNTWTIASDHRTKRNLRRFEGGMEIVRQLEPTLAEYNGRGGTPDGARVVSLDPYKLREIVPHAVSSVRAKLNESDEEETDLLGVNTHEVFYHMLRAIQQLDREVRQLKGEL